MRMTIEDTEISPDSLGDLILNLIWNKMREEPHVDYKATIDISKDSDFAKTAKHIFAMANRGGGWLIFGVQEDDKKKLVPIGLDSLFVLDQAALQEKFNSFSSEPIEIGFRFFEKTIEERGIQHERKFLALFIPPSKSKLIPIKDGWYIDISGKKRIVFKKNDVLIRRGTQSIRATNNEEKEIEERAKRELQRISFLSGRPDKTKETIFGNLLKVSRLPTHVYEANLNDPSIPLSRSGSHPFSKQGSRIVSFCPLDTDIFQEYITQNSTKTLITKDLLESQDGQNLVTHLLNLEATAAMKANGFLVEHESRSRPFFYPGQEEYREEEWNAFNRRITRKVVRKFYHKKAKAYRWHHNSVSLAFTWIGQDCYLRVTPGILLTADGIHPIHNPDETTTITSLLARRFNAHFRYDFLFFLDKMPKSNSGEISFGDRVFMASEPVRAYLEFGISGDTPSREQKQGPYKYGDFSDGNAMQSEFLTEPMLLFGGRKEEEDPRLGLKYFGPFHSSDERPLSQLRVGIVATGEGKDTARGILQMLRTESKSPSENRFLFPDYPGFSENTSIACRIEESDTWGATIRQTEIDRLIETGDSHERIWQAVELYREKVEQISLEDNRPDVILCMVPRVIYDWCGISEKTRGVKQPRYTKDEREFAEARELGQTTLIEFGLADESPMSFDLHDALKGRVMQYNIPVQILLENSAEAVLNYRSGRSIVQDPATFSWNLSTALYYKADGKPWRLAKLETDTCYVGISFYKRRDDPLKKTRVSMAQVFTHSGDGFVLRGSKVNIDDTTKQPYLSQDAAHDLLKRAIDLYTFKTNSPPSRVVVHKTSRVNPDERRGFLDAIGSASADLVCIRYQNEIRFFRTGNYPILRGTLIKLTNRECLLYTSGYIPRLRTYPGPRIPRPLFLELDCDSDMNKVASEILKLTKIDWNTAVFATKYPITIVFPQRVGNVLSELPDDITPQGHYKFYM